MSANITDVYSKIFNRLQNKTFGADTVTGWLQLDAEVLTFLNKLESAELTDGGSYEYSKAGKRLGEKTLEFIDEKFFSEDILFKVELHRKKIHSQFVVCNNWNELLAYEECVKKPVNSIFLIDKNEVLDANRGSEQFINYQNASKVFTLIHKLAKETEGGDRTIFYERPLAFEFTLLEADLDHPIDLDVLEKILSKDLHKEAITCLLCKELVSFLKDVDVKKRFSYLIQHLSSLVFNVQLSYQGYVENYTFDKVRKEYQEKRSEYTQKVYDVFDNVATKLLSLPAGIWFATTQVEASTFGSMEFAKNVTVLVTVTSLVAILVFNLFGQFSNLKILKKEYVSVFEQLALNFEDEADDILRAKGEILSAETKVQLKLGFSIFVSFVLLGLTFWLFCKAYN